MKRAIILAVVLAATVATGQWLERAISLPDSLGGMNCTRVLLYDSVDNKVYVGGEYGQCIIAIDAENDARIARMPAGRGIRDLCHNPVSNKVYGVCYGLVPHDEFDSTVVVIDSRADTVLEVTKVGCAPRALCWNSLDNKVYCANFEDGSVTVIDGVTNLPLSTVRVGYGPVDVCYNPTNNRVYSADYRGNSVSVIDCYSDTVVAVVPVGTGPIQLSVDLPNNRIYVTSHASGTVSAIDCGADTILATVGVGSEPVGVCYFEQEDKLYVGSRHRTTIIDCATLEIRDTLHHNFLSPSEFCVDPGSRKVYGIGSAGLLIVDGTTDSLLAIVSVGVYAKGLCFNSRDNKVYTALEYGCEVTVVDGAPNQRLRRVPVGDTPTAICLNPLRGKVYCACSDGEQVAVVDVASGEVVRMVSMWSDPRAVCYNEALDRVYALGSGTVHVLDCATDSVIAQIPSGSGSEVMVLNTQNNRLYCASWDEHAVVVIDCDRNEEMTRIDVDGPPSALCYSPTSNKVFCAVSGYPPNEDSSVVVIDGALNVVTARLTVAGGPFALCWNSIHNKVYCTHLSSGDVAVIDAYGDSVLAPVEDVMSSRNMCFNPREDKLYLVGDGGAVIDCSADTLLTTFETGRWEHALQYSARSNLVYCANAHSYDVTVVDCSSDRVVATVPVAGSGWDLCVDSAQGRVYVANYRGSRISVLRDTSLTGLHGSEARTLNLRRQGYPTLLRGTMRLSASSNATLLDVAGRHVMDLTPGENDIRHLAPGVYFVFRASGVKRKASSVHKVVFQR